MFSDPLFRDLERAQITFNGIAAYREFTGNVSDRHDAWIDDGAVASGSYVPVLGLSSTQGRLLDADDDRRAARVVVLSHRTWLSHFNENPGVLDDQVMVNGVPLTIAGVAPPQFEGTALAIRPTLFVRRSCPHCG